MTKLYKNIAPHMMKITNTAKPKPLLSMTESPNRSGLKIKMHMIRATRNEIAPDLLADIFSISKHTNKVMIGKNESTVVTTVIPPKE